MLLGQLMLLEGQVASVATSDCLKLWAFLGRESLAVLLHAQVTSRMDYCNALHVGLPLEDSSKTANGAECSSRDAGRQDWSKISQGVPPPIHTCLRIKICRGGPMSFPVTRSRCSFFSRPWRGWGMRLVYPSHLHATQSRTPLRSVSYRCLWMNE